MTDSEKDAIEQFIAIQTRGDQTLSNEAKISVLTGRRRRFVVMIGINVMAVAFFSYSIYFGISQLPKWALGLLFVTFCVNIAVIVRQFQWTAKAMHFLKTQG